jgi:hypothetical protein
MLAAAKSYLLAWYSRCMSTSFSDELDVHVYVAVV